MAGSLRAAALLAPSAVTGGLGVWQLRRRGAKETLLEERAGLLAREPRPLLEAVAEEAAAGRGGASPGAEFTPVVCRGVLDEDASLRVGPRARSEMGITKNGGLVVSPLRLEGGGSALVLRGWAPDTWHASEAPPTPGGVPRAGAGAGGGGEGGGGGGGGRAGGVGRSSWFGQADRVPAEGRGGRAQTVRGMLRHGERPGPYTPKNDPARGQWFFVDPPAMARALGLPEDSPLVEIMREPPAASEGGGAKRRPPTPMEILALRTGTAPAEDCSYPAPRGPEDLLEFPVMPRDHLNYAATWLTLSAAVGAMALRFLRGRGAGGAPRPPTGGGLFPVNPCAPPPRRAP